MAEQMTGEDSGLRVAARRWIAETSQETGPAIGKWPRAWRFMLVIGAPAVFWAGLVAAIHWG